MSTQDANMNVTMDGAGAQIATEVEILAKILQYFTAEELREARLVSRDFNEAICTHPNLLWGKNQILVDTHGCDDSTDELDSKWTETTRLVSRHSCPNLHLFKTSLVSHGAWKFFRSPAPQNVKHLKMTRCTGKSKGFFCVLERVSRKLEHLEIVDFSYFNLQRWPIIRFQSLASLILRSKLKDEDHPCNVCCLDLPVHLLQSIVAGCPNLSQLILKGWSSGTCQNCLELLQSLSVEQAGKIERLEISCWINKREGSSPFNPEQYSFLKEFQFIQLRSLKKLSIKFNQEFDDGEFGPTKDIVNGFTSGLAAFLDASSENLKVLELFNCPVSNKIFLGKSSFPSLVRMDTRGTFVTRLGLGSSSSTLVPPTTNETTSSRTNNVVNSNSKNIEDPPPQSSESSTSTQEIESSSSWAARRSEFYSATSILLLSIVLLLILDLLASKMSPGLEMEAEPWPWYLSE